jgi:hypothetical protein
MKTANGVHPNLPCRCGASCDAVAGEVTAKSVAGNSAKIKAVPASLAAIETHFGAAFSPAFFKGQPAIL